MCNMFSSESHSHDSFGVLFENVILEIHYKKMEKFNIFNEQSAVCS